MRTFLATATLLASCAGCTSGTTSPPVAPSADQSDYAATYPSQVEQTSAGFEQEVTTVQRLKKDLKSYPDALEEPDWEVVLEVYRLADADGENGHYAKTQADNAVVARFFVDEEKDIVQRTSGSVNYQAKEKGCDVQFYGAVDHGLERAIEERLTERQEQASEAIRRLDQLDAPKGDANVATLRKQSKKFTLLSYLLRVALPQRHAELERLVSESSQVERTLEKREKELADAEEPKNKHVAQARTEELENVRAARAAIEEDVKAAETLVALSEQQIEDLRASYEEEFDGLIDLVRKAQRESEEEPEQQAEPASKAGEDAQGAD